ncbi:hypothetical protein [Daejeonella oryzae]|uniref:hypothetical protein n=1 Tax=Daejeonella oryzae TaxID=1122943 RepID=UPI00040DCD72|nr:hypothetical protein [Daejeonella oryzae]
MKINDYNSLDDISEKDMLKFLYANQIQIMRQISNLQWHLDRREDKDIQLQSPENDVKMFVDKTDTFTKQVNNFLAKDDLDKGVLKL